MGRKSDKKAKLRLRLLFFSILFSFCSFADDNLLTLDGHGSAFDENGKMILGPFKLATPEVKFGADFHAFYESLDANGKNRSTADRLLAIFGVISDTLKNDEAEISKFLNQPIEKIRPSMGKDSIVQTITELETKVLDAYNHSLRSSSSADMLAYMSQINQSGTLSTNQKLLLIQIFGSRFLLDFDFRRNNQGLLAKGSVTTDELLSTAKHNTDVGFFGGIDGIDKAKFAGVCRDIAAAQVKMFDHLGFKNPMVVAFVPDSGTYHATAMASDPKDSQKIYKINYDVLRETQGKDGASALYQGPNDITLTYILSNPRTVAVVPSSFYQVNAEMAGSSPRTLDIMANSKVSAATAYAKIGENGKLEIRLFGATDSSPTRYAGVGVNYRYAEDTMFPGNVGIVLGTHYVPENGVSHEYIYGQIDQRAISPALDLGQIKAHLEGYGTAAIMGFRTRDGNYNGNFGIQGDLRLGAELIVKHKHGSVEFTHLIGTQIVPGFNNIQNLGSLTAVLNKIYLINEGKIYLFDSPEDVHSYLLARSTVAESALGLTGRFELGYVIDRFAFIAAVGGRLTGDSLYEEGRSRYVSGSVYYGPFDGITAFLEAKASIDNIKDFSVAGGIAIER